jgi:predicted MPP superfamily phosphohydrolase
VALILIPIVIGVAGSSLGMLVLGRRTVSMGPFRVQLTAQFGRGVTDVRLPPFGQLSADTHRAPLRFTASLRDVQLPELTEVVDEGGIEELTAQVERDAKAQIAPFAVLLFGAAVAGALGLAVVAFRTNLKSVAVAVAAGVLVVGGSELAAYATYDPGAFASPTYSGSLALAPRLIGEVRTATERIDAFRDELRDIVDGAVRVYSTLGTPGPERGEEVRVLHISDIHLSPLGLSFAQELAREFDVDLVVDTGDLTSFGTDFEEAVLSGVEAFHRPYLFVRGNHDARTLGQAMEVQVPNATVLNGTTVTMAGIRFYGLAHPAFTPDKTSALDDEEVAELARRAGQVVLRDVEEASSPPDVVLVHDDRMAESVAGRVPLVLSGHFHRHSARVVDGTLYLRAGTTGGAGADVFTEPGGIPLSAQILYFSTDTPRPTLVGFDVVEQSPETGSLTIDRHLVAGEFGPLILQPSPTLSPSDLPSPRSLRFG